MELVALRRELENLIDIRLIKYNEFMKNHTSFKVGGPADIFITPDDREDLSRIIEFLRGKDIPFIVMGNGSNLLVKDGGIRGVVICLTSLNKVYTEGNKVSRRVRSGFIKCIK